MYAFLINTYNINKNIVIYETGNLPVQNMIRCFCWFPLCNVRSYFIARPTEHVDMAVLLMHDTIKAGMIIIG